MNKKPRRQMDARSRPKQKNTDSINGDPLLDDLDWDLFLTAAGLDGDPDAADAQALLWLGLDEALNNTEKTARLRSTFRAGISEAHKHSSYNAVTIEEYMGYIAGDVDIYVVDGEVSLVSRTDIQSNVLDFSGSLFDDKAWTLFLNSEALRIDPGAADVQARLWLRLDEALDQPAKAVRLRSTFREGIRKAQAHSTYSDMSLKGYIAYIKNRRK